MEVESGNWIINYIRDGLIEEIHEGIMQLSTQKVFDYTPYYLRSCAKPLQATLLVDYGIELTEKELAFCCGSHSGEDCHIETALGIMKRFGIEESDLRCGIHAPLSKAAQKLLIQKCKEPTVLHNNCSGKHIGFLAICKTMNWDISSYDNPFHPLQKAVKEKINKMCKVEQKYPITTDGCGVPILSMPLYNICLGYINLLNYPQILNAIKKNSYIYGGDDRTDSEIIQKTDNLIAKVGAGGLCAVLNINKKEAFIVKSNDASYEARQIALFEYINRLGWGAMEYNNYIQTIFGKVVGEKIFSILQ